MSVCVCVCVCARHMLWGVCRVDSREPLLMRPGDARGVPSGALSTYIVCAVHVLALMGRRRHAPSLYEGMPVLPRSALTPRACMWVWLWRAARC